MKVGGSSGREGHMARAVLCGIALLLLVGWSVQAAKPQSSPRSSPPAAKVQDSAAPVADPSAQYRAVLDRYCVTCHNEKLKTAGLLLDRADIKNVSVDAEVWEKVIRRLRTFAMPPVGLPRPDRATYGALTSYLETSIDRNAKPSVAIPTIHRLNRAEYANAIRDLLAIDIDAAAYLPPDDSGYGFDNIADVLSVSPTLLERY